MNPNRPPLSGYPQMRGYNTDNSRLMHQNLRPSMMPQLYQQQNAQSSLNPYPYESMHQSAERVEMNGADEFHPSSEDDHLKQSNSSRAKNTIAAPDNRGKKRSNSSMNGKSEQESSRRKKKAVSCEGCRRRKLKCDRGWPCGACRDRDESHLCSWEGGTRPQATGRDQDNMPLLLRMAKMESLLEQIAAQIGSNNSSSKTSKSREVVEQSSTSFAPDRMNISYLSTTAKYVREEDAIAELWIILKILPDSQSVRKLCQYYFNEVNWMHYSVEEDEFWTKLREHEEFQVMTTGSIRQSQVFDKHTIQEHLQFLALVLCICAISIQFSDESEFPELAKNGDPSSIYGPFIDGSQRAFNASNPWEEPTLLSLRVLMLQVWAVNAVRGPSVSQILLSLAIHQMNALGLDVEPDSSFNTVEARDRIRLFHSLVIMDWFGTGTIKRGYLIREEPIKHPYIFGRKDTEAKEKDGFLLPDMWLKLDVARINRRAADRAAMTDEDAYATTQQLQAELGEIISVLPEDFETELNVERDTFDIDSYNRLIILLVISNQLINLHKRYYIRGWTDPEYRSSKDICFSSARRICLVFRKLFHHIIPMQSLMEIDTEQIEKVMLGRQKTTTKLWLVAHSSVGACLLLQHHYALMDIHGEAPGSDAEQIRKEIVEDLRCTRRLLLAMSARSHIARSGIAVLARPELICNGGKEASTFVLASTANDGIKSINRPEEEKLRKLDLARDLQSITDSDSFAIKRYQKSGSDKALSGYRHRTDLSSNSSQATPPSYSGTPSMPNKSLNSTIPKQSLSAVLNGQINVPQLGRSSDNTAQSQVFAIPEMPTKQQQQSQFLASQSGVNGADQLSQMEAFLESALSTDLRTNLPIAPEQSFERQADRIGGVQPFMPAAGMMGPMSPFTNAFLGQWDFQQQASQVPITNTPTTSAKMASNWY